MVNIRGREDGPIRKPTPKKKKPRKALGSGGRKPKEAGRRYEKSFAEKYGHRTQLGSGAFGAVDPSLVGDVLGEIGRLKLAFETKSWDKVDGKGEKVVSFHKSLLDKIEREAELLGRAPIFIYHIKNDTNEWAVVKYSWLQSLIEQWERDIQAFIDG